MTYSVTQFWQSSSIGLKLALGMGLLVVILLTFGTTKSCVSAYKDRQADKAIAAAQAESTEHRKRADEAELKARQDEARRKDSDAKAALAEAAVNAAGAKAEAIAEKVKAEDAKLTEELQRVGDVVEPCERVRRVCARLRIKAEDCSCTSN